jgi:hypothetical protein
MLVYTFSTYQYTEELKEIFPDVFIFGNLKDDLNVFKKYLMPGCPNVLGIASTNYRSRIEPFAVNKFNIGLIDKNGPEYIKLFLEPKLTHFNVAENPTTTFCNWTMYKIAHLIHTRELNCKFSFIHLNSQDVGKLVALT